MSDVPEASRAQAAKTSLVLGVTILLLKLGAAWVTGSAALLSDGLESFINVTAAAFLLWSTSYSAQPADKEHPYGHGKIEFVSAAFEGGLVSLAALAIFVGGVDAAIKGRMPHSLDVGLGVSVLASLLNLGLGLWLVKAGKRLRSLSLEADGKHVLSDVWTTAGVLVGVGAAGITGWAWVDGAVAAVMGVWLAREGTHLVKRALDGLLDAEDPELVLSIKRALETSPVPEVANVHKVRVIRSGARVHVDAHIHLPANWTVKQAHDAVEKLEAYLTSSLQLEGDVALHLDPGPPAV